VDSGEEVSGNILLFGQLGQLIEDLDAFFRLPATARDCTNAARMRGQKVCFLLLRRAGVEYWHQAARHENVYRHLSWLV
jgi:hypothetical protein